MEGSDDDRNSMRPANVTKLGWRRLGQSRYPAGKDLASLLGCELRAVFAVADVPNELAGLHRLLKEIEIKCDEGHPPIDTSGRKSGV